ncbi:phosphorylase [Cylindrospermopsis raciborskii]|jgi:nucleoside phosphorylase|uniref:5'-methylthioadenosine/S-adenosylhomocysteine nucleosidase family protein n=2 Tax=Cylindrospermopsis raciborskii TaxID=77022 RepID=UPI0026F07E47|nr:phosphorylase [Cylindrospermopsis raciborskii]
MNDQNMIKTIFVPQGSEYQAVYRGLNSVFRNSVSNSKIQVIGIPMGISSLQEFLTRKYQHLKQSNQRILLMGLCGSLHGSYRVGDTVLYEKCIYEKKQLDKTNPVNSTNQINCDISLTQDIYERIGNRVSLVRGITSDTVVFKSSEKRSLHQKFGADVVDMEGFGFLEFFQGTGISTAILRVVSDDSTHDIPDLTKTINSQGLLEILPLVITLTRQPIAAGHLIRGSLRGLKQLETVTRCLAIQE